MRERSGEKPLAQRHVSSCARRSTRPVPLHAQRCVGNRTLRNHYAGAAGELPMPRAAVGSSRGLPSAIARSLGRQLGASLDGVRLHAGKEAAAAARFVGARAFTVGEGIWLSDQAGSSRESLLAHEAAHVLQQRQGARGHGARADTATLEAEAKRVEREVPQGGPVEVRGGAPRIVQRTPLGGATEPLPVERRSVSEGVEIFVSGQSIGLVTGAGAGEVQATAHRTLAAEDPNRTAIHVRVHHPDGSDFRTNDAVLIPWSQRGVDIQVDAESRSLGPVAVEGPVLIAETPPPAARSLAPAPSSGSSSSPPGRSPATRRARPTRSARTDAPPRPQPLSPARQELLRRIEEIDADVGAASYDPDALAELFEERERLRALLEQPLGPDDLTDEELHAEIQARREWLRARSSTSPDDARLVEELGEMQSVAGLRREERRARRGPRIRRDVERIMEVVQQWRVGRRSEEELVRIFEYHAADSEGFEEFLVALRNRHYWGGLFEQHFRPGLGAVLRELSGARLRRVRHLLETRSTNFRDYEAPDDISFWGVFWEGVKSGEVRDQIFAYFQGMGDAGLALADSIWLLLTDPEGFVEGIARLPEAARLFWENREQLWNRFLTASPTDQARMIGRLVGEAEIFLLTYRAGASRPAPPGGTAPATALAAEVQISGRGAAALRLVEAPAVSGARLGPLVEQGVQMAGHTAQMQGGTRSVAEAGEQAGPGTSGGSGRGRAPSPEPAPGGAPSPAPAQGAAHRGPAASRTVDRARLTAAQREALDLARARPSLARLSDGAVLWLHDAGLFTPAARRSLRGASDRTVQAIDRFAGEHGFNRVMADWLAGGARQEGARWVLHAGNDLFGHLPPGSILFEGTLSRSASGRAIRITDVMVETRGGMLWEFKNVSDLRSGAVRQLLTDLVEVGGVRGIDQIGTIRWVFNSEKLRHAGITREMMIGRMQAATDHFFRHLPEPTIRRFREAIPDIVVFHP
ncbi:MAG: DUF4157 domain-containing protein [Gemmatimonadales bacterium]|nr:MAG: DUF4157 domain-containing protein [Gemmatimonadales bacterium]